MKQEHINEIKAIIILALGAILLASLISFIPEDLSWYTSTPNFPTKNLIKITGAYAAGSLFLVFGYSAYSIVLILFFISFNKFCSKEIQLNIYKIISFAVLICVVSASFGMISGNIDSVRFEKAGLIGFFLSSFLTKYLGATGTYIILITLGVLSLILSGELLVGPLFLKLMDLTTAMRNLIVLNIKNKEKNLKQTKPSVVTAIKPKVNISEVLRDKFKNEKIKKDKNAQEKTDYKYVNKSKLAEDEDLEYEESEDDLDSIDKKPKVKIADIETKKAKPKEGQPEFVGEYRIPHLDLLEDPPAISTKKVESDLIVGAKLLEDTLSQFGVSGKVVDIERGPAITRYEIEPGSGVKVQKFTTLSDDIALAMKATVVRIVAPIPGKNRIGIEVPNGDSSTVYLKDVLASSVFAEAKSNLTLSLGKDIAGKPMIADLAEMPHLLIAGTTGSGKTVCVNGIIVSILMNATPDDVKFILVDPKMVEMTQYNDIPHLLCPTVTDAKKAAAILTWVVGEMERRYKVLSKEKVRNIKGYRAKGFKLPYIVVIIDELADLMQVSAKAVESSITRIAQLSRAVGIHLILATQRPSVDVITGVIKANFPARISFKVASKVDSRTVLDMNGAESLLGKGDMLFIQPGDAKPTRGQGNFVKDDEINRVIQYIKDQQEPTYDDSITKCQQPGAIAQSEEKDEYYEEAVKLVIETNQASVSILQRRLRLGYTRAARLIDMMEQNGVVGPYCGSKAREILVDREQWLLENLKEDDE